MKNLLIALFCIPNFLFAQGIEFFEGTWEDALVQAEKEEKLCPGFICPVNRPSRSFDNILALRGTSYEIYKKSKV